MAKSLSGSGRVPPTDGGPLDCPPTVPPNRAAVNRDFPQSELAFARDLVKRSGILFRELFHESKGTREYRRALGRKERMDQYIDDLTERGRRINLRLWKGDPLSDETVGEVAEGIARRVTTWKHDSDLQRQRQVKQVEARRERNRRRDARIRHLHDAGLSNRDVAEEVKVSEGTVRNVLKRDASMLFKPVRSEPRKQRERRRRSA